MRPSLTRAGDRARRFQFTHPGRGATTAWSYVRRPLISFQFTHPGRGATWAVFHFLLLSICFNSRTPGGVRPIGVASSGVATMVSIHAPREGCDDEVILLAEARVVSIHAPREGCDHDRLAIAGRDRRFQFTHPGRGATSPLRLAR